MKVTLFIEVQLEPGMDLPPGEEREWAEKEVFATDGSLSLHSNEIGDTIGTVTKITNFKWIEDPQTP